MLPLEDGIGFVAEPQPIAAPVDVAPEIIARVERARAYQPPRKVPVMPTAPVPRISRKRDENGLTPKTRALLAEMLERAGPDGTVQVSFSDLNEAIGVPHPPTVAPLMQCLIERRFVSIIERKGGRAKTRYLVHGITQDRVLHVPPGEPVEQLAVEEEPVEQSSPVVRMQLEASRVEDPPIVRAEMPEDPMKSPREACGGCRFAHIVGIGSMRCRRLPPSASEGHPKVQAGDWCGEFQKSA
ncbi:MAG: hypothetical protein ACJ75S_06795 [Solirubrobacterales bacterium]